MKNDDVPGINHLIRNINTQLDNLHGRMYDATRIVGMAKENFDHITPLLIGSQESPTTVEPEMQSSVYSALQQYERYISGINDKVGDIVGDSTGIFIGSGVTTFTAGVAINAIQDDEPAFVSDGYSWLIANDEGIAQEIDDRDSELGRIYRSATQAPYSNPHQPERSALVMWRQFFDHFFGLYAPDEDVLRSSCYDKTEVGHRITRVERIRYAARVHVKDPIKAEYLEQQDKALLQIYERLNYLHKRGELDPVKASRTARMIKWYMLQWLEAVGVISVEIELRPPE